ncbi:MAG: hemerythrin domain-containing protein [Zoogloeaceae bacterium]|nr:hemerythrin domain-containing protein [Zoogloeaceae bacterium]
MLEAIQDRAPAARYDIYLPIHKGLRAFMCQLLPQVGALDTEDEAAVTEALEAVRALIFLCEGHLTKEDAIVHPYLEECAPGSAEDATAEHRDHAVSLEILTAQAELVARSRGPARVSAALRLYRLLALMVGENFIHMHAEETDLNAVLWGTRSDAELRDLEARIVASLSPAESAATLRWIVPALTPAERLAFLLPIRDHAPPVVLEEILGVVRPYLDGSAWRKLEVGLRRAA